MQIIYIEWNCFGSEDLYNSLLEYGTVYKLSISEKSKIEIDSEFNELLEKLIKKTSANLVVSFNYFPTVSVVCNNLKCTYFSWIYDNPYIKVYDKTVTNECNFVGLFDSSMVQELTGAGVNTVHYLPLAVDMKRLQESIKHQNSYIDEVSFVGSLYNEKHNFYDRLIASSKDDELKGYIDGLINAQIKVYGYNFIEECLKGDISEKIREFMPYSVSEGSYATDTKVYADYYVARRLAYIERMLLILGISDVCDMSVYTHNSNNSLGRAHIKGPIDYYNDMPTVFKYSKVNLCTTLRSIKNGIPLRAMDIMGCGGFLLMNYQADMYMHFEEGKHFVSFSSIEEAVDKARYYLDNSEERKEIAENALSIMKSNHTYKIRLNNVLNEIFG